MFGSDRGEEYVTLVQVLAEDRQLKSWFEQLASMPLNRRKSELGRVAVQFHDAGHLALALMIRSLSNEGIYQMVKEVTDACKQSH